LTNHYHKGGRLRGHGNQPGEMLAEIRLFLERCGRPAVVEWGDEALPLLPDQHLWEIRHGHLFLSAWPERRSLSRKVIGIETRKPGLMVCSIQKFGGTTGKLNLLDLDHPHTGGALLHGERRSFSESFRRMLQRQFSGWKIQVLSTEMNLERSLSPRYPRAVLEKGNQRIAALACPQTTDEHSFLSFALLWHHYVSGDAGPYRRVPLALFLPEASGALTALRLQWLDVSGVLVRFNADGNAGEIDAADLGNLETRIIPRRRAILSPEHQEFVVRLERELGVEAIDDGDGIVHLRLRGLEFAWIKDGGLYSVLGHAPQAASPTEVEALASHLALVRHGQTRHREHPLFRSQPENWMESMVRNEISTIDARLDNQPLLRQVITFAATDRDVIDLVGASNDGRVAVLELKAAEDIHLPLQALDYWMRIDWHTHRGEIDQFFPGLQVRRESPRLMLIAPAVQFHPANEVILSYFNPRIETERIGLNLEWQQGLKVAFRLRGSEKPQSQRRLT
jgi:hypothetical protein